MNLEEITGYRENRLNGLRTFYDKKAVHNKCGHQICSSYIIISSAIIPVLIATGVLETHRLAGSLASGTIVAVTAWAAHAQYHLNWLRYRRTWDALNREENLFLAHVGVYQDTETCNCRFVERVEELADIEGRDWESRHSPHSASSDQNPIPKVGC